MTLKFLLISTLNKLLLSNNYNITDSVADVLAFILSKIQELDISNNKLTAAG